MQEVILTISQRKGTYLPQMICQKNSYEPQVRNNHDNILNGHGKRLLETRRTPNPRILNGRTKGDSLGNVAFHGQNGVSVVDYIVLDQELFFKTDYFIVKRPTYLSDHSQIVTWLNMIFESNHDCENYNNYKSLNKLPTKFIWDPDSKEKFRAALNSAEVRELILDFTSHTFKETDSDVLKATQLVKKYFSHCFKTKLKTSENETKKETNKCVKQKML